MRLYWHELKGELLLYTRSRELAFFTFLLPMIFFVLLGSTYGHDTVDGVKGSHYLDEAEQLADRVAVLAHGQIVAAGTPAELTGSVPDTEIRYRENGREVVLETDRPTRMLNELTGRALAEDRELDGLEVRRPSLEEVYLSLTEEEPE